MLGRRGAVRPGVADLEGEAGRSKQVAVETRINHITATLGDAVHPTVTLAEIAPADAYQRGKRGADPKFAIRHGLLRTGRLSQFVTPVVEPKRAGRVREDGTTSDPNRERFAAAVDDLFRQLGLRPVPLPTPAMGTIARQPALLAFWMIRKNKTRLWCVTHQVPVAVLIDPTGRHIQIRAPKVPWKPLHEGLLDIGNQYVNVDLKCGPEDVVRFIKDSIAEATAAHPDTLLLTHAQNRRSVWENLTNTRIRPDTVSFGAGDGARVASIPGLRHVRVRGSDGGETPECFGINEAGTGQPKGLWRFLASRVYGSTSGKPGTHSGALKGVSKIVPMDYQGKPTAPKPKAQVWNPQFIELFVAAVQNDDEPGHWAALSHDLRDAAPYVRDTTVLPWPLHLASQVEEYLLPTRVGELTNTVEPDTTVNDPTV